jgi:hypothetical protein
METQDHPLTKIFKFAPEKALPQTNTKAYVLLQLLACGCPCIRNDLIKHPKLGEAMRSALQNLKGDRLSNWNIHSVPMPDGNPSALQLDPRHLSCDPLQDAAARRERRQQYKKESHLEAKKGRIREPKAFREMSKAEKDYFLGLGAAANDEK